jgi:hypothetical protein
VSTPCSGGTSVPRSGVPGSLVIDQQYVQSILPAGLAWLYPYLPFMHGLEIGNVSSFCAGDPPAFSVPTGLDFFNLVTSNSIFQTDIVQQFMQDVTRYYLWFNLCECVTGTPLGPGTTPADPGFLPSRNPGNVVSLPLPGKCDQVLFAQTAVSTGGGGVDDS